MANLQGEVFTLVDVYGKTAAAYTYNLFGKALSAPGSMAEIIPLRYRDYYHATETGFYYLQSRYYDPTICRFINADSYVSTGQGFLGYNMFAYCGNNPESNTDYWGTWAVNFSVFFDWTAFFIGESVAIGVSIDDDWNIAVQSSYSVPNYIDDKTSYVGVLDCSVGLSLQITNDDSIYDLEGPASYGGFSAGGPFFLGCDMVYSGVSAQGGTYSSGYDPAPSGMSFCAGFGYGFDAHFRTTFTETILRLQ